MMNTVHTSYEALADALYDASAEINKLLEGTGFQFAWEYDGWAAFTNADGTIQVAATPGWDGFDGVPIQVTDENADQIEGTEDIEDIILKELTIEEYVKSVKVVLSSVA